MKQIKILLVAMLLLVLGPIGLQAQEAILATGGDATASGGSVSYSVGQIIYTTNSDVNGSVAQGVQQPFEISEVSGLEDANGIRLKCTAYPNPTMDHLTIRIDNYNITGLSYQIYDLQANLLEDKKLSGSETLISMEKLAPAIYFLKITDNQKEVKIFKIIKN